jgi:hypothetical protein
MEKVICKECDWRGTSEDVLEAPNPFDPEDTLTGCPGCKQVDTMVQGCFHRGCLNEAATGGFSDPKDPKNYVWACYEHSWLNKKS